MLTGKDTGALTLVRAICAHAMEKLATGEQVLKERMPPKLQKGNCVEARLKIQRHSVNAVNTSLREGVKKGEEKDLISYADMVEPT